MTPSLFFIYDPQDAQYLSQIEKQLQVLVDNGLIIVWHQGKLAAGSNRYAVTETELGKAQIILPIVSADFFNSDNCRGLLKDAYKQGKQIVPIIASSCLWDMNDILANKSPIPKKPNDTEATPISDWKEPTMAYAAIARAIGEVVKHFAPPVVVPTPEMDTKNSNNPLNNNHNMSTQNLVFENGYALLIGVGKDLPATINDATALRNLLINPNIAAFPEGQVQLLTEKQVTRQGVLDALSKLKQQVGNNPDASVIISYAGHGDVDANGQYSLRTYDYIKRQSDDPLWGDEFTEAVNAIPSKKKLVILDCCHAGGVRGNKKNNHSTLIKQLEKGGGSAILAACKDDETAADLGTNGLFTKVLLQALETEPMRTNKNGYIALTDIMNYFTTNFNKILAQERPNHKQTPIISNLQNYSLTEDFIVCAYNIVKARGSWQISEQQSESEKRPISDLPPTNANTINTTGNNNIVIQESNNNTININTHPQNTSQPNDHNMPNNIRTTTVELIRKAKLQEALTFLAQQFPDNTEIAELQRRYSDNEKDNRRGIIDRRDYDIRRNTITATLLDLLNEL